MIRHITFKKINIVGNQVFDDEELTDLFQLTTTGWWAFLSKRDQYSKPRLAADLETLRAYYLDRGYINFQIDSTQVSISPDKQDVYITINVTEGERFHISRIELTGDLVVDSGELTPLIKLRDGDVFSRKKVTESTAALSERLGEEGYSFANINAVPDIDNDARKVKLS